MAEFTEVMRQWRRMCDAFSRDDDSYCKGCPITDYQKYGCDTIYEAGDGVDWEKYEVAIMTWVAEHPEPVYPSVAKYLERLGIIIRRDGTLEADFFKAHEPMNADVAKLLSVDLAEGENEKTD